MSASDFDISPGVWRQLTILCLRAARDRLRANYRVGTNGFTSKRDVFNHFMRVCKNKGVEPKISHTFFGKIVKRYSATLTAAALSPLLSA
jgi:hypothetical protein